MPEQIWNPDSYQRHAGFVPTLGAPLLELLAPQAGERILDLGCGDGALTLKLKEAGCQVFGIDSSEAQIAAARARGLEARVMDAHALPFSAEFDAVFSNAALHWMLQPRRVLAGVAAALKPGGRFVGEMGGAGNVASVVEAYRKEFALLGRELSDYNPWFFPDETTWSGLLAESGLEVLAIERFARPTPLPGDVGDWLNLMTQTFLAAVPEAEQPVLIGRLRERLRPSAQQPDGSWCLDYVRLRFVASKRA